MSHQPRLVVIDTKANLYSAYKGKKMLDKAQFNRPLYEDEIEAFRMGALDCDEANHGQVSKQ